MLRDSSDWAGIPTSPAGGVGPARRAGDDSAARLVAERAAIAAVAARADARARPQSSLLKRTPTAHHSGRDRCSAPR